MGGKLIRVKDIMEKYSVSKRTVSRWIEKGMPVIKKDGVVRFEEDKVWEWFTNGK